MAIEAFIYLGISLLPITCLAVHDIIKGKKRKKMEGDDTDQLPTPMR